MKPAIRFVALAALIALVSGCATWVTVKPYTEKEKGLRYSLADPYLLVEPQPDGSAKYTWLFLPNEDRQYAVSVKSFLSMHTLEVELDHGLLKKATSKPDSSGVASKFFENAGTVLEAEAKAKVTAETAKETKLAAALEAHEKEVAAARKALLDAELELAKAKVELTELEDANAAAEKILDARIKVRKAQASVDAAKAEFDRVAVPDSDSALNDPTSPVKSMAPEVKKVWGPMLFRVEMDESGGVQLRAVHAQAQFPTSTALSTGEQGAGGAITFSISNPDPKKNGTTLTIVASEEIDSIDPKSSPLLIGVNPSPAAKEFTKSEDKKTFVVTFKPQLAPGKYSFTIGYLKAAGVEVQQAPALEFDVAAP